MKVDHLVPEVYYKDSRDFAYIGRLFEVIFNYMKTGADCVKVNYVSNKDVADSGLVELLADTLGFTVRRKYDNETLAAIASSFQKLLRNKGSIYAVELALNLLINAQTLKSSDIYDYSASLGHSIESYGGVNEDVDLLIQLPAALEDTILLEDLFDYILPAGMIYKIIYTEAAQNLDNSINKFVIDTHDYTLLDLGHNSRPLSTIRIDDDESGYLLNGTDPYILLREVPKALDSSEIYPKLDPSFTVASFNCGYRTQKSRESLSGISVAKCLIDASKSVSNIPDMFDVIVLQNIPSLHRLNAIADELNNSENLTSPYICIQFFNNKCGIISKLPVRSNTDDELAIRDLEAKDGNYGYIQLKYPNNLDNSYKTSRIHKWLNNDFITHAFTEAECEKIREVIIDNTTTESTGYESEINPNDKNYNARLFLLSRTDAKKYGFNSDGAAEDANRKKTPSDYALALINDQYDAHNGAWWWTRTASAHNAGNGFAHKIKINGTIDSGNVMNNAGGIIPAMYCDKVPGNLKFGSYPQTALEDADLINTLNNNLELNDFIKLSNDYYYADVEYDNIKYRALQKTENILVYNGDSYKINVKWFIFEDIKWTCLDNENHLYFADTILDISMFADNDSNVGELKEAALNIYLLNDDVNIDYLTNDIKNGKIGAEESQQTQRTNYLAIGPIGVDTDKGKVIATKLNRSGIDMRLNINYPAGGPFNTYYEDSEMQTGKMIDDMYYHNNAWNMQQLSVVAPKSATIYGSDETISSDKLHSILISQCTFKGPYRAITDNS